MRNRLRLSPTARPTRKRDFNGWFVPDDVAYDEDFLREWIKTIPIPMQLPLDAFVDPSGMSDKIHIKEFRQEYKVQQCGEIKFGSYADRNTVIMTPLEAKMRKLLREHDNRLFATKYKWRIRLFLIRAIVNKTFEGGIASNAVQKDVLQRYGEEFAEGEEGSEFAAEVHKLEMNMLLQGGIRSDQYESSVDAKFAEEALGQGIEKWLNEDVRVEMAGNDDVFIIVVGNAIVFVMNSEDNGVSGCENYYIACGGRVSRVRRDHLGPYRDSAPLRVASLAYVAASVMLSFYFPFAGKTGDDTVFEKLKTSTEILAFMLFTVFGIIKLFSDDEKVIRTYLTGKVRFGSVTDYAEFLFPEGKGSLARLSMSNHWDSNLSTKNACYMRSVCDGVLYGEPMKQELFGKAAYYRVNMYIIDCIEGKWYLCESRAGGGAHFDRMTEHDPSKIHFAYDAETGTGSPSTECTSQEGQRLTNP